MRGKAKGAIVNPSDETRKTANRANIDAAGHANVDTATRTASDVRRAGVRGAQGANGEAGGIVHGTGRNADGTHGVYDAACGVGDANGTGGAVRRDGTCGTQGALHGASRGAHCAVPGGSGSEKLPWGGVLIEGAFPMGGVTVR